MHRRPPARPPARGACSHGGDVLSREGVGRVADQQAGLPHGAAERARAMRLAGRLSRLPSKGSPLPRGPGRGQRCLPCRSAATYGRRGRAGAGGPPGGRAPGRRRWSRPRVQPRWGAWPHPPGGQAGPRAAAASGGPEPKACAPRPAGTSLRLALSPRPGPPARSGARLRPPRPDPEQGSPGRARAAHSAPAARPARRGPGAARARPSGPSASHSPVADHHALDGLHGRGPGGRGREPSCGEMPGAAAAADPSRAPSRAAGDSRAPPSAGRGDSRARPAGRAGGGGRAFQRNLVGGAGTRRPPSLSPRPQAVPGGDPRQGAGGGAGRRLPPGWTGCRGPRAQGFC